MRVTAADMKALEWAVEVLRTRREIDTEFAEKLGAGHQDFLVEGARESVRKTGESLRLLERLEREWKHGRES